MKGQHWRQIGIPFAWSSAAKPHDKNRHDSLRNYRVTNELLKKTEYYVYKPLSDIDVWTTGDHRGSSYIGRRAELQDQSKHGYNKGFNVYQWQAFFYTLLFNTTCNI